MTCALCSASLDHRSIIEPNNLKTFCCSGCHAVYQILDSRRQLEGYKENPLFLQAIQSGLISNPAIADEIRRSQKCISPTKEKQKIHLQITDMWCPSCSEIIKLVLSRQRGIANCVIDYTTDFASVEFFPQEISKETITSLISSLGYRSEPLSLAEEKSISRDLLLRFGVAAFCAVNIMMLAYPLYATYFNFDGEGYGMLFAWLSFALSLPVIIYSAKPIWHRLYNSIREGIMGMEVLIGFGTFSALVLSLYNLFHGSTNVYFDSLSALIAFTLLGKMIESRAKFSAKHALLKLVRSTPRRGRKLFSDGSLKFVPLKEVSIGDILVVCSGEKISLDGMVINGSGACDESVMTGEAMPVTKTIGAGVLAGTLLVQGTVELKVTCGIEQTALNHIMNLIEKGIGQKASYIRAADHIVQWFIPIVLFLAMATAVVLLGLGGSLSESIVRFLTVLLIACPCAIGIAAPTAESYVLNALGASGVIVRNRAVLSIFGSESVIVFDKTGTVTEGRYEVIQGGKDLDEKDKEALGMLASRSNHPVSCAIAVALTNSENKSSLEHFEEVAGQGIRGWVDGIEYLLGSKNFLSLRGISVTSIERDYSQVYAARNGLQIASFILGDRVKKGIQSMLAELGSVKKVLLSGDSESVVSAVAKECGFDNWKSSCSPIEKKEYIESLKKDGCIVCMIGDGINDALALTAADVGISVVSATDISIQVSDILLTTDRLEILVKARKLARFGQTICKQNMFWAFAYNIVGIGLACFGYLSPIFSAFAMSISSLSVLFNSKRIH